MEVALEEWAQINCPEGVRARELTLPPADGWHGDIDWPSQNSVGEFTLVVWVRESRQADQLSYHPGPDPGL